MLDRVRYVRPSSLHLGDIVNVVQQYHLESASRPDDYFMHSDAVCPCCGAHAGDTLQFVLGLLDTRIRFKKLARTAVEGTPMWLKRHVRHAFDYKPYAKAKKLPKRGKHVAVQFDGRSQGNKRPKNKEIEEILDRFPDAVNVGDRELPCRNRTGLSLAEKFELIASARLYVGIDSGLTHLALMTGTPTHVIHPVEWKVRRYYPKSPQIRFSTTAEELLGKAV